jgi:hypothetical protein
MLAKVDWNIPVFNQLRPKIQEELERTLEGAVYDMMFLDKSLYFKINLEGNDFHTNERLEILAVHFEHKTIECLIAPEKLNCVKQYFSV